MEGDQTTRRLGLVCVEVDRLGGDVVAGLIGGFNEAHIDGASPLPGGGAMKHCSVLKTRQDRHQAGVPSQGIVPPRPGSTVVGEGTDWRSTLGVRSGPNCLNDCRRVRLVGA
jgi:hypothetical protein